MLDINDLERRWLRYKIKSYTPYFIIIFSLVIIVGIASVFFPLSTQKDKVKVAQKSIPKKKTVIKIEQVIPVKIKKQKESSLKMEPSLNFMKKMQNSAEPYYTKSPTRYKPKVVKKKVPTKKTIHKLAKVEEDFVEEAAPKAEKITITRQNTKNDISEIIQRFKKNNNPALSLFVAKKYYELANYDQSYNYALITNNINSDIEQSWIIFAKSLVKLHKKDLAIKTLRRYIKSSHSSTAQILLEEILSGEFQ